MVTTLVSGQLAALFEVTAVDIDDHIAVYHVSVLIHAETAVRIAVKGKTDIQAFLFHQLLQALDVGGNHSSC